MFLLFALLLIHSLVESRAGHSASPRVSQSNQFLLRRVALGLGFFEIQIRRVVGVLGAWHHAEDPNLFP